MRNQLRSVVIALMLGCLPVQMMVCEFASAQTISDRKAEADRLFEKGNQLSYVRKYQEALPALEQSLKIYREIKDRNGEEKTIVALGVAYNYLGEYAKANEYLQQLEMMNKPVSSQTVSERQSEPISSQTVSERQAEADRLLTKGSQLYKASKYEEALQAWEQALQIYRDIKNIKGEGAILYNLGAIYYSIKQYKKALEYYQPALVIYKQVNSSKWERNLLKDLLLNIGVSYGSLGEHKKAIEFYEQSLIIAMQENDLKTRLLLLTNIGSASIFSAQYQKAIEYYQQSLALAKQLDERKDEGRSLIGLGTVYRFLGEYEKSIVYFQQSLALAKQNIDWSCEACSLQGLGIAYNYLSKPRKAIEYHQQSLAIAKQNKNRRLEAESFGNLGIAYDSLEEYQKAIEYHLQSLEIHRQIGDQVGQGPPLKNLGNIYFSLGQYQKAIEYYQQALAIYRQFGNHNYEGKAFSLLGSAFVQKKQPELAILFYKQSVNVYESIRKSNKKLSREEQQSFTRTVADAYRTLSDLLLKKGRVTEALQVLDLLKIQELEDYLKNVKGNNITEKGVELLAPEKAISDQLSSLSLDKIPELNQQLASKLQQLPKSEINKVPPYFQNIPQGAVLIYPFILEDRIELIIYSPNTLPINRTIPIKKEELQQLVTDFRRDLQGNGTENIKISSKKLYDLLIKPIETELQQSNATTILYAPDGVLRYIPLAALYDGKQYLIEKYRINNLIAYSLFDQNRKTQTNPSIFAGAYGNSNQRLVSGFSQLPATIPEVDSIQNTFANTTKITEKDFTAQASKDKAVGNSIVHLATHASFRSGSPLDSYVLFGDGSKATIFDISEWNLKDVNLFVLSACQTGLGTSANGAEILGFGYQVQRAGAKASIASLWEVSDGATQLLMQAFYSQIKQGNISTSEALRQAQIAMINSDKKVEGSDRTGIKIVGTLPNNPDGKLSHPYYWSAFVLIGNGL